VKFRKARSSVADRDGVRIAVPDSLEELKNDKLTIRYAGTPVAQTRGACGI